MMMMMMIQILELCQRTQNAGEHVVGALETVLKGLGKKTRRIRDQ